VRRVPVDGGNQIIAVAGPDAVVRSGPPMQAGDRRHESTFTVEAGQKIELHLTWFPSHQDVPAPVDVEAAYEHTAGWWNSWAERCRPMGVYHSHVVRSMLVLRALTHEATGGIVAAATTSLPENFGGQRNWDYRYVWLRDAALTLEVLLAHGYEDEAEAWRGWLLRAVAGDPEDVQIMYGLAGERYLPERHLDTLPGYRGASPVRVGNAAVGQFQSDVIGEVMVALHDARERGIEETEFSWPLQRALVGFLEDHWRRPDQGLWEMRGPARAFTHSRVMVWAAFDRAVRAVTEFGLDGPVEHWRQLRDEVRHDIETHGYDAERNTFVQHAGGPDLDAALLVLPQVGFCAPGDPRMLGTVEAIERELLRDGLVLRYLTHESVDGLPPGEHPFLACSFWLVEQYAASGRLDDAVALMDRLVGFANDVGLLSEEYDVEGRRQAGNTPQAFSHLTLVRAADAIARARQAD
jgi:GH15 family glucan-1,4-alpha-glucosidase